MKRVPCMMLIIIGAVLVLTAAHAVAQAQDSGQPQGGVLNYGEYGRPATLDPVTSNDMISLRVTELLFNGLVGINEKQEIVPELAERWEISPDGKYYTFFLRQDVTWHAAEGQEAQPLTADDVVFTNNIMMHPKTITPLKVSY